MKERNSFTVAGKIFSATSGFVSILSYIGIPIAALLAIIRKNFVFLFPASVLAILLVLIKLCKKNHKKLIKFILRLFSTNTKYKYEYQKTVYEYKGKYRMHFCSEYAVKALQTGVDHIRFRYKWTGSSKDPIIPKIIKGGDFKTTEIRNPKDEYGYKYYKLCFNSCNKSDKSVKVGFHFFLDDPQGTASPHLGTNVNVATDLLHLVVILPKELKPQNINFLEYIHATDDFHWHKEGAPDKEIKPEFNNKQNKWIIEWKIDKPIIGGKYLIVWSF